MNAEGDLVSVYKLIYNLIDLDKDKYRYKYFDKDKDIGIDKDL